MAASAHYVVHVVDEVDERLAGHHGCFYTSPPQPADAALELVRALGGCTQRAGEGPWQMATRPDRASTEARGGSADERSSEMTLMTRSR